MNLPLKIILFLLSNLLGFFMASTLFVLIVKFGLIDLNDPNFNARGFSDMFLPRVMLVWLVCGVFSISGVFIGGYWRLIFLLAPAIVPFFYGLSLLAAL